jgi:hypothetical protein
MVGIQPGASGSTVVPFVLVRVLDYKTWCGVEELAYSCDIISTLHFASETLFKAVLHWEFDIEDWLHRFKEDPELTPGIAKQHALF